MKVKFALVFSAVCLLCSCGSDNKVPNTVEVAQTQTTVSDIERTTAPTTVSTEEQTSAPATTSAPAPPEDLILSGAGNVEVYDKLTVGDYIVDCIALTDAIGVVLPIFSGIHQDNHRVRLSDHSLFQKAILLVFAAEAVRRIETCHT